jgi:hypothetical protein
MAHRRRLRSTIKELVVAFALMLGALVAGVALAFAVFSLL